MSGAGSGHEVRTAQRPEVTTRASLSLDLDNQWSYMKTHGDAGWERFRRYLDIARAARARRPRRGTGCTSRSSSSARTRRSAENRDALGALAAAGPRDRQPLVPPRALAAPLLGRRSSTKSSPGPRTAIEAATGVRPWVPGPGYSLSGPTLRVLVRRGYAYDASTLPTYIGPLARAYYFRTAKLDRGAAGRAGAALRHVGRRRRGRAAVPVGASTTRTLLEIPVTTLPGVKVPIHVSYLLMLSDVLAGRARAGTSTPRCGLPRGGRRAVAPAAPARPPRGDDVKALAFFPGMSIAGDEKLARVDSYLDAAAAPLRRRPGRRARCARSARRPLPVRPPDFAAGVVTGSWSA